MQARMKQKVNQNRHDNAKMRRQKQNLCDEGSTPGFRLSSQVANLARAQASQGLEKEVIRAYGKNREAEAQNLTRHRRW
jgi:hypothetical protein